MILHVKDIQTSGAHLYKMSLRIFTISKKFNLLGMHNNTAALFISVNEVKCLKQFIWHSFIR